MAEGAVAEFAATEPLVEAARLLRGRGCRDIEVYSPYPIPELESVLDLRRTRIPVLVLAAAICGAAAAYTIIWWCNAHDFHIDVGGRPLDSIPADVPIMFETAVLFAALTAFVALMARARMVRLHDATSAIEGFERASVDRFWLSFSWPDAEQEALAHRLRELGALEVRAVGGEP